MAKQQEANVQKALITLLANVTSPSIKISIKITYLDCDLQNKDSNPLKFCEKHSSVCLDVLLGDYDSNIGLRL